MSRAVSALFRAAANASETGELPLVLVVISHASLATPIRVVDDTADLVVGSDTYIGCPIEATLPPDTEDSLPSVSLRIQNVDRVITDAVRALDGPPDVSLRVVLRSQPTTVEAGPFELSLQDVEWDALVVSATIGPEPLLDEPVPSEDYTPQNFPGLF